MTAPAATDARISAPVLRACMSRKAVRRQRRRLADCRSRRPDRIEIDRLSADHAGRAGGVGDQRQHAQLPHHQRGVMPLRFAREQAKRFGLQTVAGENRHAFAVHDVRRRPPAPQVIVIHRRQVVVDQRIGVDHFDRARRRHRARRAPRLRTRRSPARRLRRSRARAADAVACRRRAGCSASLRR